jgi:hypothetical protein
MVAPVPVFVAIAFGCVAKFVNWNHTIARVLSLAPAISIGIVMLIMFSKVLHYSGLFDQAPIFLLR